MILHDVILNNSSWNIVLPLARKLWAINLDREELIEFAREWEVSPTIASRRIFTLLGFVNAAAVVIEINISGLRVRNLTPSEDGVRRFLLVLKLVLWVPVSPSPESLRRQEFLKAYYHI